MADQITMQQNMQSLMRDPELPLQIGFAKQRSHEVQTEAHVVSMILRSCNNNDNSKLLKGKKIRKVFSEFRVEVVQTNNKTKQRPCAMLDKITHPVFWKRLTMGFLSICKNKNLHSRPLQIFSSNVVFMHPVPGPQFRKDVEMLEQVQRRQ